MTTGMNTAAALLEGSPYLGYTYSYPHKTAYRPLRPARRLRDVFAGEDKSALFLYVHVPFCEMRCGFCNLFTTTDTRVEKTGGYLDALRRQADVVASELGDASYSRFAIGGGTPTYLSPTQLEQLFASVRSAFGISPCAIPTACETSPTTASPDRLDVLEGLGVERISIGVQTFDERESRQLGRTQRSDSVEDALAAIRDRNFPVLNVDLIYGGEGQDSDSFERSLRRALEWTPEELYLYPLYVRPLTGLGKRQRDWDDVRIASYRRGRHVLLSEGYEQVSMRMFRRAGCAATNGAPQYRCQSDGMIGLGSGARSYAESLHYSSEYAVGREPIRELVAQFNDRADAEFGLADYGFELDREEKVRRFVLLSLLQAQGLPVATYRDRFAAEPCQDLPELLALAEVGLIQISDARVQLTESGLERSDAVGPWLYSARVRHRMESYSWR